MSIPWRLPKIQIAIFLLLIFISSFLKDPSLKLAAHFSIILLATLGFDLLFLTIRRIKPFLLSADIVSALIVTLLLDPNLPIYQVLTVCGLLALSKNFLRVGSGHIFNPAGFGLFLGGIVFNYTVSWWGVSFQRLILTDVLSIIFFLILISPGYVSALRMKRHMITLPFLVVYSLGLQFFGGFSTQNLINAFLDPTVLFFSLVMLPEPMTTPHQRLRQILFGITVAIITISISRMSVVDPLILGLLIGNLIFFKFK